MFYLNREDFYYGAVLTALIGSKYKTVLIDGTSENKRIYAFTSDNEDDFIGYMKYSMAPTEREGSTSWQVAFSDEEIKYLTTKINNNENIKLIILCGKREFRYSEVVIIEKDEIPDSIFQNGEEKKSITVFRKKKCENYRIPTYGGRINDILIPTNRMENARKQIINV